MAHWNEVAVTSEGVELLNEMMAGHPLKLTSAYGGSGIVDPPALREQTAMVNQKQKLALVDEQDGPDGKTVTVQISSARNSEEYLLRQIGVYAKLDMAGAEEKLLFLMQDKGVVIPAEDKESFLLEIYCTLRIGRDARLSVTIDPAGIVTLQRMKDALGKCQTLWDEGDPTVATVGTVGQHYLNILTKKEFICVSAGEEGYVWQVAGANIADDLTCGGKPLTEVLGEVDPAEGVGAPTGATAGAVGQKYTDTSTGTVYTCIAVSLGEGGATNYTWVPGSLGTLADIRAALHNVSAALSNKAALSVQQTVEAVTVPYRVAQVAAAELQGYLDAMPRLLTDHLVLEVVGMLETEVHTANFYGPGSLFLDGKNNLTVRNKVYIEGFDAAMLGIRNVRFEEPNGTTGYTHMLRLWGGGIAIVQNCQFVGLGSSSSASAIHVDGPIFTQIHEVSILGCGTALFVSGGATAYVDMGNLSSAAYSGNQQGIIVHGGGTAYLMPGVPDLLGGTTNGKVAGLIVKSDGTLL